MYRHIVFIRLKNCSAANLGRACAALEGLIGHVAGLRFIEVEKVEDPAENDGCHLCANMLYDTKEAMAAGRQNPAVQKVRSRIQKMVEQTHEVAYPITKPARQMPRLYTFIGPSNRDRDTLARLLDAGMTGIRISLLHHDLDEAMPIIEAFHGAAEYRGITPEVLLDPAPGQSILQNLKRSGATGLILSMPATNRAMLDIRVLIGPNVRLFAKVDCRENLTRLPELMAHADEIIVARGEMSRSMPHHEIPAAQKQVARISHSLGKPYMVATDLLLSMQKRHFPSAAEVCDIYNAVHDGAASLMLAQVASTGDYPVEAMEYLRRTAEAALVP